jgi:uncharacterized protein (TIGR03067 family)
MYRTLLLGLVMLPLTAPALWGGEQNDVKFFQGKWKITKIDGPGPVGPMSPILSFNGNMFSIELNGKEITSGSFRLDATKNPKQIDLRTDKSPSPASTGKVLPGIYQFQAGQLILCINEAPNALRPTEFKANGPQQMSITLEKVNP